MTLRYKRPLARRAFRVARSAQAPLGEAGHAAQPLPAAPSPVRERPSAVTAHRGWRLARPQPGGASGAESGQVFDTRTVIGRASPGGPLDDLHVYPGHWLTGPGQIVPFLPPEAPLR